jgi:hypothetical protein
MAINLVQKLLWASLSIVYCTVPAPGSDPAAYALSSLTISIICAHSLKCLHRQRDAPVRCPSCSDALSSDVILHAVAPSP